MQVPRMATGIPVSTKPTVDGDFLGTPWHSGHWGGWGFQQATLNLKNGLLGVLTGSASQVWLGSHDLTQQIERLGV